MGGRRVVEQWWGASVGWRWWWWAVLETVEGGWLVVQSAWWARWVAARVGGGVVARLQKFTPPKIGIQVSQETRLVCVCGLVGWCVGAKL